MGGASRRRGYQREAMRAASATAASGGARQTQKAADPVCAASAAFAATAASVLYLLNATGTRRLKNKGPGGPGLLPSFVDRLLQRAADGRELGVQRGAEIVDDGDDGQRDAGGDQAVFDGGGAGFIVRETRNQVLHEQNSIWGGIASFGVVLDAMTMRSELFRES